MTDGDRDELSRREFGKGFMAVGALTLGGVDGGVSPQTDVPTNLQETADSHGFVAAPHLLGSLDARPTAGDPFFDEKTGVYVYQTDGSGGGSGEKYWIAVENGEVISGWNEFPMPIPTNQVDEVKTTRYDSQFNLTFARPNEPTAVRWSATNVTNDTPEVVLTGTASLQSKERGNYAPGSEAIPGVAFRLTGEPQAGETATAGYYTADDGFGFGRDATGSYAFIRMPDGSEPKVYRGDWNGTEPPNFNDFESHIRICRFEHLYYGGGAIEMQIVGYDENHRGKLYTVHTFTAENLNTTRPPFGQPNLPVAFDTDSLTPELRATAAHYEKGELEGDARYLGEHATRGGIDDTDWYHVVSWRKKSGYDMLNIKPMFINAFAASTNIKMEIQQNPTLGDGAGGEPVFQEMTHADPDESPLEWITGDSAVIDTNGDRRWAGHAPAGQGSSSGGQSLATLIENLDAGDTVTLAAQSYSGTGALFVVPAQQAFY